jgi:outer membrane immunogenic protein
MIRTIFAAASFVAIGVGSVCAADLASRPYKAPMTSPIYDWSGFYVGLNAGAGWAQNDHSDLTPGGGFFTNGPGGTFGGTQRINSSGALYGGHVGYNWQMSNIVLGLEVAGDGANIRRTDASLFFPATDALTSKVSATVTATGRVGYAFNNWLPYIKGGYAGAQLRTTNFDTFGDALDHSDWRSGYTVGAGLEVGLTPNWTMGVEYNYLDFGNRGWSGISGPALGSFAESFNDNLHVSTVTGRVTYRFGGPVIARY